MARTISGQSALHKDMKQKGGVETGENLHWGQQLWAGLGVHPYVQMWVRV